MEYKGRIIKWIQFFRFSNMHYIVLDTNIYRELGVSFHNNIDFSYLSKFIRKSPHELMMLDVVNEELLDFFQNEHMAKLISDYKTISEKFEKNEYLESIPKPNFKTIKDEAVQRFKTNVQESCWKIVQSEYIDPELLLQFLLHNKRQTKKDNTRDFLILLGLVHLSNKDRSDKIIFISRDKIFTENQFFKAYLEDQKVANIEVLDSISKYMSEYGIEIEFLNDENVLESIDYEIISNELRNDIDCFPSYVSMYYNDGTNKPPKNISLEILNVSLNDFYSYSEDKLTTVLITSLIVEIKAVYGIETKIELKDFGKEYMRDEERHRIDGKNRPIFEGYVLFMFESELDLDGKKIIKQNFIDFIPDWNVKE
jgi:hypothetical protein